VYIYQYLMTEPFPIKEAWGWYTDCIGTTEGLTKDA
jgi:hypothetical protein